MNKLFFMRIIIVNMIIFRSSLSHAEESNMIFHKNIMFLAKENNNFRTVLATASHSQIVLMSLKPGEDIGNEVHKEVDQTLVFIEGKGIARIASKEYIISPGDIFLVPAGTEHNFINKGEKDLKLFTVYAPAEFEKEITQKFKPKNID